MKINNKEIKCVVKTTEKPHLRKATAVAPNKVGVSGSNRSVPARWVGAASPQTKLAAQRNHRNVKSGGGVKGQDSHQNING